MKATKGLAFALLLGVQPTEWALAQQPTNYVSIVRQGYSLDKAEADKLEAALAVNPDDLEARTRLIGYYWRGARQETPAAKIWARRKHILWVIEHHPAS